MKGLGLISGLGTNLVTQIFEQGRVNDIIRARAHQLWEYRVANNLSGSSSEDWKQAKHEYNLALFNRLQGDQCYSFQL